MRPLSRAKILMFSCIGYHGTSPENVDSILQNGYKLSGKDAWFGSGVYFFGDLLPYFPGEREAIQWMLYYKRVETWAVIISDIRSEKCFDMLEDSSDRQSFDEIKNALFIKHVQAGKDPLYFKDNIVFKKLEDARHFEVIRALVNASKNQHIAYTVSRPQVQICVKNLAAILSSKLTKTGSRHDY